MAGIRAAVVAQFRSLENERYLARELASRAPPGSRDFLLSTLRGALRGGLPPPAPGDPYDTPAPFAPARYSDAAYDDPLAQRADVYPERAAPSEPRMGADFWGEVRRLNRGFIAARLAAARRAAAPPPADYLTEAFESTFLRPAGKEELNDAGPLYGLREQREQREPTGRAMRYEAIPPWQISGHRRLAAIESDYRDSYGSGLRESGSSAAVEDGTIRTPWGEEVRGGEARVRGWDLSRMDPARYRRGDPELPRWPGGAWREDYLRDPASFPRGADA